MLTAEDATVLTLIAERLSDAPNAASDKILKGLSEDAKPIGEELLKPNSSGSAEAREAAKAIRQSVEDNRSAARDRRSRR